MRNALALILILMLGCREESTPSPAPTGPSEAPEDVTSLLGTWRLDAETRDWIPRACVVLTVADPATASIEVVEEGSHVVVRLLATPSIPFTGRFRDQTFEGRQILATTASGRFCGSQTAVRLQLGLDRGDASVLSGTWSTPDCDVCPDRRFVAHRSPD
jgi:hypothetical protein